MSDAEQEQPEVKRAFELRSPSVQEIIGRDPNWLVRWGTTMIFFTVFMLILATWIISYPEIISTRVTITTQTPPVRIVARTSGKIDALFVGDGETVVANQYLAILENTADNQQAVDLRERLNEAEAFLTDPDRFLAEEWPKDVELGDIQVFYSEFLIAFNDYQNFVAENFAGEQVKAIRSQIRDYERINQGLQNQRTILADERDLLQRRYDNNKRLFEQELLSETDLADVQSRLLQSESALQNAETNLVNNRIRIQELRKDILEREQQAQEQRRVRQLAAQDAFKRLDNAFRVWEQTYVLQAPLAGQVAFFRVWSLNQFVNQNDEVLTITPDLNEMVGKVYLPQFGAGKVEIGQEVNIKFDAYPFQEFGIVRGEIASISRVARENQYLVNINLPGKLNTTYNKELQFKYNMEGSADIVTRDMRLIERIFNQFRHLFKNT